MLQAGTTIGQVFSVLECVGEGGGGSVYRCLQAELNREVAIKLLHPSLVASKEARDRFSREAKILSTLKHPNIAQFFQWGMDNDVTPYIAMEFITGKSLQDCLAESDGKLPWKQACSYAIQMCAGLNEIHAREIVHRDVKPANFVLTSEGIIKLVDFGLAKSSSTQTLTDTGLLVGSIHYMSPEACRGQRVDHRADIYAIGCALYTMIYGEPPFDSDAAVGLLHKHSNEAPIFAQTTFELPQTLVSIMRKCLEKNPDLRYQSALEIAQDLEAVINSPGPVYRTRSSQGGQRRAWIVGLTLVALAGIIGVIATRLDPKPNTTLDQSTKKTAGAYSKPRWIKEKARRASTIAGITKVLGERYLSREDKILALQEVLKMESPASLAARGAAFYWLGEFEATNAAQRHEQALTRLLKAQNIETGTERCSTKELIARIYIARRDYSNAEKYIKEDLLDSEEFGPTTPIRINCYRLYMQICQLSGRMKDCLRWTEAYEDALLQKQQGQAPQIMSVPNSFVPLNGTVVRSNRLAVAEAIEADCALLSGNLKQGREHAEYASSYSNPIPDPDLVTAGALCKRISLESAEKIFRSGKSLRSEQGLICTLHLADCLAERGAFEEAQRHLAEVTPHLKEVTDRKYEALYRYVEARCNQAQGMSAEEAFAPLLKLTTVGPADPAAIEALILASRSLRAQAQSAIGGKAAQPDNAVTPLMIHHALEQLIGRLPDSPRTKFLIQNLLDLGLPNEALLACNKVGRASWLKADPAVALLEARALSESGQDKEARRITASIRLEIPPNPGVCPTSYCELLMLEARYCNSGSADAIRLLREANNVYLMNGLVWYPSRVRLLRQLATLCSKANLPTEAILLEKEATTITSQAHQIHLTSEL
ncbi:MAG: serine/threonine protein kinase [Candidatus Obscuribacterales bacterium]|nr:serine/threonine protein kinase [Candidatus Obscuribacterales bacterium]